MEASIKTFKIKIKKDEREIVMFYGGFATKPMYRITNGKEMRRPTSYEYQKIYKILKKEILSPEEEK